MESTAAQIMTSRKEAVQHAVRSINSYGTSVKNLACKQEKTKAANISTWLKCAWVARPLTTLEPSG
eukprot:12808-Eustigmatos_ZCMA.PRE.1